MRWFKVLRSQAPLVALVFGTVFLVTAYFTGIPWVSDNVDPVFHTIRKLYSALWSNMWAPSIWTLSGFVVSDIRHARRAVQVKTHHTDTLAEVGAQLQVMSDKLNASIGGNDDNSQQPG